MTTCPSARIALVLWLASLAGCAAITFKRGASPGSMAAAEDACRDSTTSEATYVSCLRERGWFVATPGRARGDAPGDTVTTEPEPPEVAPAPPATIAPGVPGRAHEPASRPASPTPPTPSIPADSPTTKPATPSPRTVDPLARVEVTSWWKLGGNAGDLDQAIAACVTRLGPAHRPEAGARVVTAGLRGCLRAAGWVPVGESVPR